MPNNRIEDDTESCVQLAAAEPWKEDLTGFNWDSRRETCQVFFSSSDASLAAPPNHTPFPSEPQMDGIKG